MTTMTKEQMDFYKKTFDMNMEVKNLLYIASVSPSARKAALREAQKLMNEHWNIPKGYMENPEEKTK